MIKVNCKVQKHKQKYNALCEEQIIRVNQVFDKIFGNSFKDYRHGMLNIFAKSHLNSKVYE